MGWNILIWKVITRFYLFIFIRNILFSAYFTDNDYYLTLFKFFTDATDFTNKFLKNVCVKFTSAINIFKYVNITYECFNFFFYI